MSQSLRCRQRGTMLVVNRHAKAMTGRRVLAVSRISPMVPCQHCNGFTLVKTRDGSGALVAVACPMCTADAPTGR